MDLSNMWFVSKEKGENKWQGQILTPVTDKLYLAQLYSWLDGSPTCLKIIDQQDIAYQEWDLYKTNKEFLDRNKS